jgi:lysyl-tRNA synthetase class I
MTTLIFLIIIFSILLTINIFLHKRKCKHKWTNSIQSKLNKDVQFSYMRLTCNKCGKITNTKIYKVKPL